MDHEDFQPKHISTVQSQTGRSSMTKSPQVAVIPPQVAVIPPLVDLTKVSSDSDDDKTQNKDGKSKGLNPTHLCALYICIYSLYTCI